MRKSFVLGLMLVAGLILFNQATFAQVVSTVSGRVTTPSGYGISKARITIINQEGTEYPALTNPFGYYSIELPVFSFTHFVTCSHKFYTFTNSCPIAINIYSDIENLDFVSDP